MSEAVPFSLPTPSGQALRGVMSLPSRRGPRPAVLDCHGFKGFMEWGFHPYLADLLAARGYVVVRFNFTSSGMQPGDELVTDEQAFATTTFGEDVREIQAVLEALHSGELGAGRVDADRLALLGHSRGGGTSILAAASDPWRERLKALVTWASVGTFDRVDEESKLLWRRNGALPVVNARTGQELALSLGVLDDLEAHRRDYDLQSAAARRSAPWLLLHGSDDATVPVAEAASLAEIAGGIFENRVIAGGSHTFGAQHPFVGPTPQLIEAMNLSQRWLHRHLNG